ncbi:SPC12 domain-containing protein [Rhizoctonia solani AG-1 IA]|uniref:SPC12 domain-containing protein n=1 Tax=Thanatephorus cucumeris (strain AG1-IA) TaxID=983506 RepID=L8WR53_THACA|nr:SPC12 domain-containing protein [Rhizoctonia solani AG-1 IA]
MIIYLEIIGAERLSTTAWFTPGWALGVTVDSRYYYTLPNLSPTVRHVDLTMSSQIQAIIDGKIDFEGQELVETTMHYALVGATAFSFVAGYVTQSLQICFGSFTLATLAVMLVCVPLCCVILRAV